MIFPIGDDQVKGGHKPIFSYGFIALNVLIFAIQSLLAPELLNSFMYQYGAIPSEIINGKDFFTLITSLFLHGGWMHLVGNMMFLWVFGDNIEAVIGNFRFVVFYLIGGVVATSAHILSNLYSPIPTVGASGAIAAVLGAYLLMFPYSRIKLTFLFLFSGKIPAILFLGIWIVQQLFNGFATIGPASAHTSNVAWWAHIGGFAFGIIVGIYFRLTRNIDTNHKGEFIADI